MIGDTYRFKVGDFDCIVFRDVEEHFRAGRILSSVPVEDITKALVENGYDPENIGFSMNLLLIHTPQGYVLVDTGVDRKQDLPNSLKAAGVQPEDIARVIITHGHGDHIGGIAYTDGVLTYPNARYSIWKEEWDYWWNEGHKAENPNLTAKRSLEAIEGKVDFIDHESEILPGICAIPAPGHTVGHIAVELESKGERLLHVVDAAHNPIQILHPEWSPNFDAMPDVSPKTRKALFERAAAENIPVLAYHFEFPGLGYVVRENGQLKWQAIKV